jgi:hypothetical protein
MAKRKAPRPATPTRARGPARARAAGGGSTRRPATRGARPTPKAGRAKAKATRTAAATKRTAKAAATLKGKRQKPSPAKAKGKKAPRTSPRGTARRPTPTIAAKPPVKAKGPSATRAASKRRVTATRPRETLTDRVDRERRALEETVRTPPSSLNFDRRPSAARSGRAEMEEALAEHTETSPALTGGDVDADWEAAYSSGDEAPGGDMPTPDQGVVEDIGTALGVEYQDDEELKGAVKIEERDHHRWELDPASSEDYQERAKPERRKR